MIARLKRAADVVVGRNHIGRELAVYPEDVFIVSYPRSGNTWMRFLLGNLLNPYEPMSFYNMEDRIPDIYQNTQRRLSRLPSPRILKSHEPFDPRYERVIYIVRDPRDAAISYYHYLSKIRYLEEGYPIERYVSSFVFDRIDKFGSWRENVGSWLGARHGSREFLLVYYEDLLACPVEELRRVARFLSISDDEHRLRRAVELSSADRMRWLEKSQGWKPDKFSREDKPFVRYAGTGDWETTLPKASAKLIEKQWGELIEKLGYLR